MPYKRSIRLKNYDYSADGTYFVTICTLGKSNIITEPYKKILKKKLQAIEKRFPGVKVDFHVFMPNHCHIIFIFENSKAVLPKVVQAFKSLTTLGIKRSGFQGTYFWQKNYCEHVIRDNESLNRIRTYIKDNPEKERIDVIDLK